MHHFNFYVGLQNFYLIDVNIVVFITVLLARRLVYLIGHSIITRIAPTNLQDVAFLIHRYCSIIPITCVIHYIYYFRCVLFTVTICILLYYGMLIVQNQILNMLYLSYP